MNGIAILGASGGLGAHVATVLARRAPVCLGYAKNRARAQALADDIRAQGGRAEIGEVDMRFGDSVAAFLGHAQSALGGLGAIVSATGPALPLKPLADVTDDEFHDVYSTDVRGSFNVLKHGAQRLAANGGGALVLFLTTAVLRTLENDGMSGCPKSAVAAMIKQIAREMGPRNVRCNGIAPAVIDAGIIYSEGLVNDPVAQSVIAAMVGNTPLGRMGRPEEVSSVVDFLVSPGAGYITGQIIGVDGGFSA